MDKEIGQVDPEGIVRKYIPKRNIPNAFWLFTNDVTFDVRMVLVGTSHHTRNQYTFLLLQIIRLSLSGRASVSEAEAFRTFRTRQLIIENWNICVFDSNEGFRPIIAHQRDPLIGY